MTLNSYVAPYSSLAALAFEGNPNNTISAINTSGGITCSRTSGQTPCFIQASASAITATGTDLPYEDLSYSWDFGDADSAETFTNPGVGGGTVNSNDDQTGPEAVHCYREAGTFTITLTIRGKNGSLPFVVTTATQQITVTTFSASGGEYWVDSVAGNDANDGLSTGAPKQTIGALNTLVSSTSNVAVHIKKGSSFSGTTTFELFGGNPSPGGASGLRVDAYGTGDKPVFDINDGTNRPVWLRNGGSSSPSPKSDIVVSGLHFKNSGTSAHTGYVCQLGASGNSDALVSNVYIDNCTFEITTQGSNLQMSGTSRLSKFGIWGCTLISPITPAVRSNGMFTAGADWSFVYGGSFFGGTTSAGSSADHHIYPDVQNHTVYRWIDFQGGDYRNFCINANWDKLGASLEYAQYHLFADNDFSGLKRAHDLGNGPPSELESLFRNVVCQGNKYVLIGSGQHLFPCAETYTNRDNEVVLDNAGCGRWYEPVASRLGAILTQKIYRNKIYVSSDASAENVISLGDSAWTIPIEFTDNIIYDARAASQMISVPFTQQAGATIDRNQYYSPNDGGANGWRDGATEKTFAQWQAQGYDINGSVADPGWADPANGDFS